MISRSALAGAVFTLVTTTNAAHIVRRGISTSPDALNGATFDYVIVGGGAAGLALANRLTEDGGRSVAVIEAGNSGEEVMERILIPALTYSDGVAVPGAPNDWGYWTESLGRGFHQPRGKILGGSTAVNALYVVRASAIEHDAWASLLPDASEDWSWEGFFPYMTKSETFHPPPNTTLTGDINPDFHGTSGPVQVSYPQFVYDSAALWVPTLANLGLKTSDPQGGEGWGGYITPNSINPSDGTRSYSKTAYLDPVQDRSNLQVLLEHQATKILFDTNGDVPRTRGVQFQRSANDPVYEVYVRQEVILASGVFGTPQLLELSGVGSPSVLEPLGIEVVADVPGVGEHFQDHVLVSMSWLAPNDTVTGDLLIASQEFKQEQIDLFNQGDLSRSLVGAPNNGIGYVNLRQLMGDEEAEIFMDGLRNNMTAVIDNMSFPSDTVRAGYELTYQTEMDRIIDSDVGVVEILLGSFGSYNVENRTVSVQVAIQHPMSRGRVHLNTTNPFDSPIITANYLNTDSDWTILRAGVRYLRRLAQTEPLSSLMLEELRPGADSQSDGELDGFIWEAAGTQYHPASTASMLPFDKGGVVGPDLKVYGVEGLRVIDSSVIPIGLCAHLMQPTYAIAEKGAEILINNPISPRGDAASSAPLAQESGVVMKTLSMGVLTALVGVGSWILM